MTNEEAKVFLDNLIICVNEHPIVADWLVEIANRKVKPNCSEKPNNCETCLYRDCPWDAPICDSCTMANSHYERDEFVKDTNVRSKPNDCKYAVNPSGDVWECGCCLEIFCEHQIYDRNPDGTLNIVKCGFEPKTEPQTEREGE